MTKQELVDIIKEKVQLCEETWCDVVIGEYTGSIHVIPKGDALFSIDRLASIANVWNGYITLFIKADGNKPYAVFVCNDEMFNK